MYRKSILAVCIVSALMFGLAINRGTLSESRGETTRQESGPGIAKSREVPTHLPYLFLFEHLNRIRTQAEDMRRQGKDGSGFQRRFKKNLNDRQFNSLDAIAEHCKSEIVLFDQQAKVITDEFRKKYPPGVVPQGVIIPPPPDELIALQEMRTNAVLRARDRVRAILGDEVFESFDENLKRQMIPNIQPTHPQPE